MKLILSYFKKEYFLYVFVCLVGLSLAIGAAYASTTISTDVVTGGNMYATSTMAVTGAITGYSTLTVTGAINASSTIATSGNITVPAGYAIDTAGAGVLNIGTSTATSINIGKAGVPAVMVNASSTLASFGGGTTVSNIAFGTCTPTIGSITASTTLSAICTGSEAVNSTAWKVFVTPNITEDINISFVSASSTALGIQVTLTNRNITGVGAINPTDNAWSWMAIK